MGARPSFNLVLVADEGFNSPMDVVAQWRADVRSLLATVPSWLEWPIASVECVEWTKGRVVLLGDAAHAMTPHAAQGGAMAIEDAEALALALKTDAPIEACLGEHVRARRKRTARVSALSASNRKIYQLGGAVAFARDRLMQISPPQMLLRRMDWLYGGD
jgi:salicylate hydroxylase